MQNGKSCPELTSLAQDYFDNIGDELDELVPIGGEPMCHVHEEVLNSMFLFLTSNKEVYI